MKRRRKKAWLKRVSVLLLVALFISMIPCKVYKAEAANLISPEYDHGFIWNGDYKLSYYEFSDDGLLTLENTYHYEPGPILTYYTIDTIWSKNKSNATGFGYPKNTGVEGRDWVKTGVSATDLPSYGNCSYSDYYYPQDKIRSILTTLYGELKPDVPYTVYMSELFILKQRHADGTATYYRDKIYDNIDAIRGAAGWTAKTNTQFAAYYDIKMEFTLAGGTVKVVCVDMDRGNSIISDAGYTVKTVFEEEVNIVPSPTLTVDGETLGYAQKYGIGFGIVRLDQTGYPAPFTMQHTDVGKTFFLGYSRTAPPPSPPATPGLTPGLTPGVTPTNTPTPTPTSGPTPPPITPVVTPAPTAAPSDYHAVIRKEGQKVQVYADDYNASTDSLTDLQPYLVDGVGGSQGSIPSTEQVAIRAKAPGWEYEVDIKKVTGTMESTRTINVPVTINYQTYVEPYPNPYYPSDDDTSVDRNEHGQPLDSYGNVIPPTYGGYWTSASTSTWYNITIKADKSYSYWEVVSADTYKADKLQVVNNAFEDAQEIAVDWSVAGAPTVPMPDISVSHEVKTQTKPTYYATGITCNFAGPIDYSSVYNSAYSAAYGYTSQIPELLVKSDKLVIDDVLVLNDTQKEKDACEPEPGAESAIKAKIKDTIYPQTYKSGIDLKNTTSNAYYVTNAQYIYSKVGSSGTKVPAASEMDVNSVIVHTPIVCDGIVTVDGEEHGRHDNGNFNRGITVDFPLKDVYNPFTIEISNYGTHRLIAGYGERDFEDARSGDKNIAVNSTGTIINEVKFPFGVYYDMNSDSFDSEGNLVSYYDDRYFGAGTWICVGDTTPQFYVMGSLTPGEYSVDYRSIATNCPKDASGNYITSGNTQNNANKTENKYVATDLIKLNVYEDFMGFELNGTNDPVALEDFKNGQRMLTLDRGYYFNFFAETVGDRFNRNTTELLITPTYNFISEDGKVRIGADLYYHENINGKSEYYVKVGNVKDSTNVHTYTNLDELPGIDKELLKHTEIVLGSKIAGNKTDMFVFGNYIKSDRWFRMHPPITDPMPNKYCAECYTVFSETETRPCGHVSSPVTIFTMASVEDLVQDWYAGFYLPADTYCITSDTKQGFCDSCGTMRYVTEGRTTCPEHGTALKVAAGGANGVTPFSFNTYAAENTLTGDEEFFRKDGYVAINFDIMAIDSAGSFVRQYEDFDTTEIAKQWKESKFPYQTGDVVLYRLDKSIRDAYEIGGSE